MSSVPLGYHYEKAKDKLISLGLEPMNYVEILDYMFNNYVVSLPKKKK